MKVSNELQARFTVWMQTIAKRARIDFIRYNKRQVKTISFEEFDEPEKFVYKEPTDKHFADSICSEFVFENETLGQAFSKLSLSRRKILRLTFVEELKPDEIARILGCSVQNVYNERSLALKKLHEIVMKGQR